MFDIGDTIVSIFYILDMSLYIYKQKHCGSK